jgi:valyl-tRNA synthetase
MYKRYENWVNGLEWDWSISRERHFGIPIPLWECRDCKKIILPDEKELPIDPLEKNRECPKCKKLATPESKVLDTWATSSLSPQITSSLIDNKIITPYSFRPQGHDIIRTWAFYTIVKSLYEENKIPWKELMVTGFVTLGGEKMSKSKGIGLSPDKIVEEYGADALRFWSAGSKLGEDFDYQEKDLLTGKKTITKLWNATNFVFMNLEDYKKQKPKKLEPIDQLFLNKLNDLIIICTGAFEKYEYSRAKIEVDKFFWNTFTANYLEIVKRRVYKGSGNKRLSAQYTLHHSLLTILKLIAPIMPFITEEIYQKYYKKDEKQSSIHLEKWPESEKPKDSKDFNLLIKILTKVRQAKSNAKKPMNSEILLTIPKEDKEKIQSMLQDLIDVTNAQNIIEGKFKIEFL